MNNKRINTHEDVLMPDKNIPVRAFYFEYNKPGELFDLHWHEHIEITYVIEGAIDVECEGHLFHTGAGEIIMINPYELHICSHIQVPLRLYCIIFNVEILKSGFFDMSESRYMQPILGKEIIFENSLGRNEQLAGHIVMAVNEMEKEESGYELAIKGNIMEILVILLRQYMVRVLTNSEREMKIKNNSRINNVVDYINHHYMENLTIEQIAEAAYISKFYLCKIFKKTLHQTVIEYLHDVRISHAKELLKETDMSISEVAFAVGFNDFSYFSRVYKRKTGVSPSKTKKQCEVHTTL